MSTTLVKRKNNILLVAITRLGDMLQMSPTIVGIKQENPAARVTIVIEKQFSSICSGIPGIDEVIELDLGFVCRELHREGDGVIEAYAYLEKMVEQLRDKKFDYCLNMSNSAYTALLIKMLGVEDNRGWLSDEEGYRLMADPWAMLFAAFVYHSNRDYNSLNLVDIFRCSAEVMQHPRGLQYRVSEESRKFTDDFITQFPFIDGAPLVCVQAGASQKKRQWSTSYFASVSKYLVEELGANVIYTGAPAEAEIIDAILAEYPHPRVISAVGRTNFDQLAGILERASLLVTGDTGPMHLSVAVGTPVVALFLASALCFETGPYSAGNLVVQPQISCNPCNPNFPCSRPDCHEQISPALVGELVRQRLETPLGQEDKIIIPSHLANPADVMVYRSEFDADGFLEFVALNGKIRRNGEPVGFYEAAQASYRDLWKEEFANIRSHVDANPQTLDESSIVHPQIKGIDEIVRLLNSSLLVLDELRGLVLDPSGAPARLGELDAEVQELDKEIEEISLVYPMLGAIVRIWVMEKENLRGEDALSIVDDTITLYRRLLRRCGRFSELFHYYFEKLVDENESAEGGDRLVQLQFARGV
jgi:ADP-heptose:LPS heptosyltransferase